MFAGHLLCSAKQYQTACVKEAMRYAMAVPGRLPRVVPHGAEPLVNDGKIVPAGVSYVHLKS